MVASRPLLIVLALASMALLPAQPVDRAKALADLRRALGGGELNERDVAAARAAWPAQAATMSKSISSQDRALKEGGPRVNEEIGYWTDMAAADGSAINHYLKGRILGFAGRLDEARNAFEASVDRDPHFYWAWRGLGTCYAKKAMHEEAIRHYARAVELNPEDLESGINLVAVQASAGYSDRARATAAELLKWHPDDVELWWNLGGVLVAEGAYKEAAVAFENVRRLDPNRKGAARFLGTCYLRTARPEMAQKVWGDWLEAHPEDWMVRIGLAQLMQQRGQNHAAAGHFQLVLDHAPTVDAPFDRDRVEQVIARLETLPAVSQPDRSKVTLEDVIRIATTAEEPERQRRALRTLVSFGIFSGDPEASWAVQTTVMKCLAQDDPHCRIIAMRALSQWHGMLKDFQPARFEGSIRRLMPMMLRIGWRETPKPGVDEEGPVRGTAAAILGQHGGPWAVPVLMDQLRVEYDPHAFRMMHRALNELTFAYIGVVEPVEFTKEVREQLRAEWLAWWQANEARYPRD